MGGREGGREREEGREREVGGLEYSGGYEDTQRDIDSRTINIQCKGFILTRN